MQRQFFKPTPNFAVSRQKLEAAGRHDIAAAFVRATKEAVELQLSEQEASRRLFVMLEWICGRKARPGRVDMARRNSANSCMLLELRRLKKNSPPVGGGLFPSFPRHNKHREVFQTP